MDKTGAWSRQDYIRNELQCLKKAVPSEEALQLMQIERMERIIDALDYIGQVLLASSFWGSQRAGCNSQNDECSARVGSFQNNSNTARMAGSFQNETNSTSNE